MMSSTKWANDPHFVSKKNKKRFPLELVLPHVFVYLDDEQATETALGASITRHSVAHMPSCVGSPRLAAESHA